MSVTGWISVGFGAVAVVAVPVHRGIGAEFLISEVRASGVTGCAWTGESYLGRFHAASFLALWAVPLVTLISMEVVKAVVVAV